MRLPVDRLPEGWQFVNIRRLAAMKTGHTPSRANPEYWADCEIPWFTLADVWQLRDGTRTFVEETEGLINAAGLANSSAELLPTGTVLLSRTASVGFSGITAKPMATSQDFWNWICGPELDPRFLLHVLRAMRPQLQGLAHGSTHQTIYKEDAQAIEIPFVPLPIQHAISDFLDRETAKIDALIAKQEELITTLLEHRQQAITMAVTGVIEGAVGKWKKLPLRRDLAFVTSGSRGLAAYYTDNGDRFVRIANLGRGVLELDGSSIQRVTIPRGGEGSRTVLQADDLLFSITAYLGSVAVVDQSWAGAYVSQHVGLVRLRQRVWLPRYIGYVGLSDLGQRQLNEGAYGGTKLQLSLDDLREFQAPVPTLQEQQSAVDRLDQALERLDRLVGRAHALVDIMKERRAALTTAAVTGQIDVSTYGG